MPLVMPRTPARGGIVARADPPADRRGDRFAAALTALVMLGVLVTSSAPLFAAQAVVFALGAFVGLRYSPYPALYRAVVAPGLVELGRAPRLAWLRRLGSPVRPEPAAPVRGAHALGFGLAVLGSIGYLAGLTGLGEVSAVLVLAAAVTNAAVGFCPGRVAYQALYQLFARLNRHPSQPETQQGAIA
ncbi:MAG: hypothetical protein JWQ60_3500 [Pseudonocardia sp.]|nr:hypothetical protein [Pseudonocardia sp.]